MCFMRSQTCSCATDIIPLPKNICSFSPRLIKRVIIKGVSLERFVNPETELDKLFGMPRIFNRGVQYKVVPDWEYES